jgi:hypothetical protein
MKFQDTKPMDFSRENKGGGEARPFKIETRPYKTKGVEGVAHSKLKSAKPAPAPAPVVLRPSKICTRCGTASATPSMPGSGWIELILWMYIVPGMIYSIWRRSNKSHTCHACGCKDLIPIYTPAGQRLLEECHPDGLPPIIQEPPKPASKIVIFGALIFVALMLYIVSGVRA